MSPPLLPSHSISERWLRKKTTATKERRKPKVSLLFRTSSSGRTWRERHREKSLLPSSSAPAAAAILHLSPHLLLLFFLRRRQLCRRRRPRLILLPPSPQDRARARLFPRDGEAVGDDGGVASAMALSLSGRERTGKEGTKRALFSPTPLSHSRFRPVSAADAVAAADASGLRPWKRGKEGAGEAAAAAAAAAAVAGAGTATDR